MKLNFIFKREATQADVLRIIALPIELFENPNPYRIPFPANRTWISLSRPQDDNDGDQEQKLELLVSTDMDIQVMMHPEYSGGCFRNMWEGTMSPRTWNALKVVWYAMLLHNKHEEKRVQGFKRKADLKTIIRVLETYWMPRPHGFTETDRYQMRTHDDNDGNRGERFCVLIADGGSRTGDVIVETTTRTSIERSGFLRFRSPAGGSTSPLVHNALRVLALAMHLDNTQKWPKHHIKV